MLRRANAGIAPVLVWLAATAPAAGAATETVRSGALTATVGAERWALAFEQAHGGPTLREVAGGAGVAPGRLGLRTAAGWRQATRVLSCRREGRALVLRLATNDPAGRHLSVLVRPSGNGIVTLRAEVAGRPAGVRAVGIAFGAPPGERHLGLGERSDAVDQRGRTVENYVSDGPWPEATRPVARGTLPPQGFRPRDDATYFPVPWLLSSRGFGVLVDRDETSTFRLGAAGGGAWSVEVAAPALALRVFAGPTPAAALARFTKAVGRQPPPSAPWAFGPWLQTGQPNAPPLADQVSDLEKLRAADAPVSAAETQLRYLPCGLDRGFEAYEAERVAFYHREGLAVLTYVNPMLCQSYEPLFSQAVAAGVLQRTAAGRVATFNSFVGGTGPAGFTIQPVGQFDFSRRAGVDTYAGVLRRVIETGHDGWMEDFGEYTPLEALAAERTGTAVHNHYPTSYHCGVREILRGPLRGHPVVRFQRSGWTGVARCSDDVWGGDPTTTFGFDGLSSAVRQALTLGLSGISRWGSDIGGYDTIADDPKLTPELLARWIEFGAVSGVMRMKKSGLAIPPYERPQPWDPPTIGIWRRYTKLHTQLYPYLRAADAQYRRTGLPLMRALLLRDPRDAGAGREDEFLLGDDLLAAPVLRDGARERSVYLPRGRWLDGRTALTYDGAGDGAFHVAGGQALSGGRTVRAQAQLEELPLYIRAGAVLPLLPADVSTLSDYGEGAVVRLRDRLDRLRLLAFPAGRSSAGMFERERVVSRPGRGEWRLEIRGARTRAYELEASMTGLRGTEGRAFLPCGLRLAGRDLPRSAWSFDAGARVLRATFPARRATLLVRDRCG
jgi:alpha-glucosidase (family GH31 glycosyl hydrolase)